MSVDSVTEGDRLPAIPTTSVIGHLAQAAEQTLTPPSDMGGWWAWVIVIGITAIIDIWLFRHKRDTMSKKIQRWSRRLMALRVLFISILIMFAWHVVWGFPW